MADNENETLQFRVTPSLDDWKAANWLVLRNQWLYRRLIVALVAIWAFYAVLMIGMVTYDYGWNPDWALQNAILAAKYTPIVTGLLILLTMVLLPRRVKKQFDEVQRLVKESDIVIDAAGLRTSNAIGGINLAWSQFKRLLESKRVLALMITDREMILVPKDQVDDEILSALRRHFKAAKALA